MGYRSCSQILRKNDLAKEKSAWIQSLHSDKSSFLTTFDEPALNPHQTLMMKMGFCQLAVTYDYRQFTENFH